MTNGMNFSIENLELQNSYMHFYVYREIMDQLRETIIDVMPKPPEVLVVIDEYGEAVEELIDDVESIHIYELCREIMVFLTNINSIDMDKTI